MRAVSVCVHTITHTHTHLWQVKLDEIPFYRNFLILVKMLFSFWKNLLWWKHQSLKGYSTYFILTTLQMMKLSNWEDGWLTAHVTPHQCQSVWEQSFLDSQFQVLWQSIKEIMWMLALANVTRIKYFLRLRLMLSSSDSTTYSHMTGQE